MYFAEIALRVMRRDPGLYVALKTLPLSGKRLSGVGITARSYHGKAFGVTCFIVECCITSTIIRSHVIT